MEAKANSEPTLSTLLHALTAECDQAKDLSLKLSSFGNRLKRMPPLTEAANLAEKMPVKVQEDVVEAFWQEIYKLRALNKELMQLADHFEVVIGA